MRSGRAKGLVVVESYLKNRQQQAPYNKLRVC